MNPGLTLHDIMIISEHVTVIYLWWKISTAVLLIMYQRGRSAS